MGNKLSYSESDKQINKSVAHHLSSVQKSDINLNNTVKLNNEELKKSFYDNVLTNSLNEEDLSKFSQDICLLTKNSGRENEIFKDLDFKRLHEETRSLQFKYIQKHLILHDRIVNKEVLDFSDDYRPASYTSRIAIILRRLPAITAKLKAAAYASEVGESFRPVIPRSFVNFLYVVSFGYVIFDIAGRTYCVKDQGREKMGYFALDTTLFHLFASLLLPALVIHKIVGISTKIVKKITISSKATAWIPALFALSSVPFIIEPIDHVTEFFLDKGIRPFYIEKIAKEAHRLH